MSQIPNIPAEYDYAILAFWTSGSSHINRTSSARQAGVDQETVDRLVEEGFLIEVPQTMLKPQYYLRHDVCLWVQDFLRSDK